ncbi:hypothetical protein DSM112329_02898 [Paraconexibacter sp. AEG42_29]|uniref:Ig-like domain-containing protein n=1 Tax=Paraconexibacter sp. AEG42_29 TaxID=2997339 RepID=A0AAU7AWP1_9ACTN
MKTTRGSARRLAPVVLCALAAAFVAAPAQAGKWRRCEVETAFPVRTLSTSAMTCSEGKLVFGRLFRDNPKANQLPFGAARRFKTTGRTRGRVRSLTCSVKFGAETGANRGGVKLTVRCRDFRGDGMNYTEQQDSV